MGRAAIWIALGAIDHDCLSSVILFEVYSAGVAVLELKRDAPRPIHMDRIARGFEASQSMKIKAGDVHFLWRRRSIQAIQATKDAFVHFPIDLRRSSLLPKFGERLALEASDHAGRSRRYLFTVCNNLAYLLSG